MLQETRTEEENRVTLTGLTGFTGNMTRISGQIGLLRTAGLIGRDTRVGEQTGLLGKAGVTRTMTRDGKQTGLLGPAGVTETATRSREILVGLPKIWLLWKAGVWRSRLTWKARLWISRLTQNAGLWKIQLTQKTGLCKTQEEGNRKKERVLLQGKGQHHGGAQGVLPGHKNTYFKRCIKESWPKKKKKKSGTIGLTIYGP
jgi:hypothetical protein